MDMCQIFLHICICCHLLKYHPSESISFSWFGTFFANTLVQYIIIRPHATVIAYAHVHHKEEYEIISTKNSHSIGNIRYELLRKSRTNNHNSGFNNNRYRR